MYSEHLSPGSGSVVLSKTQVRHFVSADFSEHRILDMAEATDNDSRDQISPLLGAMTEILCGNKIEPETT